MMQDLTSSVPYAIRPVRAFASRQIQAAAVTSKVSEHESFHVQAVHWEVRCSTLLVQRPVEERMALPLC